MQSTRKKVSNKTKSSKLLYYPISCTFVKPGPVTASHKEARQISFETAFLNPWHQMAR